jgi:hypothetical protein
LFFCPKAFSVIPPLRGLCVFILSAHIPIYLLLG